MLFIDYWLFVYFNIDFLLNRARRTKQILAGPRRVSMMRTTMGIQPTTSTKPRVRKVLVCEFV